MSNAHQENPANQPSLAEGAFPDDVVQAVQAAWNPTEQELHARHRGLVAAAKLFEDRAEIGEETRREIAYLGGLSVAGHAARIAKHTREDGTYITLKP